MKKKYKTVILIMLVLVIATAAWFIGYYNRKSNDNLPMSSAIAEMDEAEVNSLLPGYRLEQLMYIWGEPHELEGNSATWELGENNLKLTVSFNNKGKIVVCSLDTEAGN